MSDRAEFERLKQNELPSTFPCGKWIFLLDLGENPTETWQHIVSVVEIIVTQNAKDWPSDDYWENALPTWLSSFMMSAEESNAAMARTPRDKWGQLPWDFDSWLDAMRERDWRWWGSERLERRARIVLEVTGIPPRIDAFKQILLAAGAHILSEDHI